MSTSEQPNRSYNNYGDEPQVNIELLNLYAAREEVPANELTREDIKRLQTVCVPTVAIESTMGHLRSGKAVALIGPPGSGRRTTGWAAITGLGATPHYPIYLDPDDARRDLPADSANGYLLDIDEQTISEVHGLMDLIQGYRERLARADSYLVVVATWEAWRMLGQPTELSPVIVSRVSAIDVFRSHLNYERPGEADPVAARPEVEQVLDGANPADAVRLARLAVATMSSGSAKDPVAEAIAAYHNWEAELDTWFQTHSDGYQRALLIATAVLDESDAAAVFKAADLLCGAVGLPRPEGGGLVGDGSGKLLERIGAKPANGGRVRLPRPAYPVSVIDHVWRDRPQLRSDLKDWLVALPGALDSAQVPRVGRTLVELAVRQGDSNLITSALVAWTKPGETRREVAIETLGRAAVSDRIGKSVRRTMYRWASTAGTELNLQLTMAEVCGGDFGRRFPSNALTRLRHLARNGVREVGERVVASLQSLASEPGLRDLILREVVAWATADKRERFSALSAFITLATDNMADLVPLTTSDNERVDLLAAGLHAALRDADHVACFRETCCAWLEAAAQEHLPVQVVTDILAHSCRDSYDIGVLATTVLRWGTLNGEQPTLTPREKITALMLRKAADRDPLAAGISDAAMYQSTREVNQ